MESYQNQSGAQQTHEQLDQFGNPVPATTGVFGIAGGAPVMAEGGGLSGMLHRSGSSSSSSSVHFCFPQLLLQYLMYFSYITKHKLFHLIRLHLLGKN